MPNAILCRNDTMYGARGPLLFANDIVWLGDLKEKLSHVVGEAFSISTEKCRNAVANVLREMDTEDERVFHEIESEIWHHVLWGDDYFRERLDCCMRDLGREIERLITAIVLSKYPCLELLSGSGII